MKKIVAFLLVVLMMVSITACGGSISDFNEPKRTEATNETRETEATESTSLTSVTENTEYDESDPEDLLIKISDDFYATTTDLTKKLRETFSAVGTTYEEYRKNKGLIDDWVNTVISESDDLFERTRVNSIEYFKIIAAHPEHKYYEFCDEALEGYYDTVCDDAMDEYYDTMCDDAMDDLYDEYYDGIVDDVYDDIEYAEWSEVSSECYKVWSNASSLIYGKWSNESSYIYGLWSAIDSAFCWNDNFDVDAVVAEYEQSRITDNMSITEATTTEATTTEETTTEATTTTKETDTETTTKANADSGIRSDFKKAMDDYEEFYDEYCEFIEEFEKNPSDWQLLIKYAEMMADLAEMETSFSKWESEDLTNEELQYYLEVQTRVTNKLLDVAQ